VSSIGSASPIIPPESRDGSPAAVERVVIVIHSPARAEMCTHPEPETTAPRGDRPSSGRHTRRTRRGGRHRRDEQSWFDLVDNVVHSWPLTFRVVVLVVAIATGSTAVIMALGVVGQLALAGLAARTGQVRQQRVEALRTGNDLPRKKK